MKESKEFSKGNKATEAAFEAGAKHAYSDIMVLLENIDKNPFLNYGKSLYIQKDLARIIKIKINRIENETD